MIVYVQQDNKRYHTDLLDQLFRKRYEVFKLGYKWDIPTFESYELDEYDNHYASYLISVDDQGDVIGSARFNPTIYSSMVQDHFRDYCYPHLPKHQRLLNLPRDPETLEVTRFFCRPKQQNRIGFFNRETLELLAATLELGLKFKTKGFLSIIERPWLKLYQRLEWPFDEIGWAPAPNNQTYYIGTFPVEADIYKRIKKFINHEGAIICDSEPTQASNEFKLYQLMKIKCLATRHPALTV